MSAKAPLSATAENGVWRHIQGEWRQLFGSFAREGVSVEQHNFRSEKELDWSRSFHTDSLEICLNLQGSAILRAGSGQETAVGVRSVAYYASAQDEALQATRIPGEHHHFVTVELSREYLARRVGTTSGALEEPVRAFVSGRAASGAAFAVARPMSLALQSIARALAEPPFSALTPAGRLWYESKILELVALLLFAPLAADGAEKEMFCDRQKRLTRERVEQACALLKRDLENPPTLEMLAEQVGCGTFHLSRMFSQHVGQTVPQFLRQVRLERAAQLLREGRHNVTEAATAVGYSSLSHFSKAFWETYGCCPGLYGNAKLRDAAPSKALRRRVTGR